MCYLFFHMHVIYANAAMLALYALPSIVQASIANAHVQGRYRHTSWAEVYETVLAWYVALPTTLAMINPKLGKFNVTAKGGLVDEAYYDWTTSLPYLVLVLLNFAAVGMGIVRLLWWNAYEPATVIMNLLWTLYSLLMLGAAMGVASESRQVRRMHRVTTELPAALYLDDGRVLNITCTDYSMTGLGLQIPMDDDAHIPLRVGEQIHVGLWWNDEECALPAEVVLDKGHGAYGVEFPALSRDQQIEVVQCTFARPESWKNWSKGQEINRPLRGLGEVAQMSIQGYRKMGNALWHALLGLHALHRLKNRRLSASAKST
jgi:cellulose synthase (UDP-forming)